MLGFLDDAIMIELAPASCATRSRPMMISAISANARPGIAPNAGSRRPRRLARESPRGASGAHAPPPLHANPAGAPGMGYGSSSGYGRVSKSYTGSGSAWRPGVL